VARLAFDILIVLIFAGAIGLALLAVFWLPGQLFEFKKPIHASMFVPCFVGTVWLLMSTLEVVVPGILIISPHKLLAGLALIGALLWSWVEETWL
jgi:hypothetical protein